MKHAKAIVPRRDQDSNPLVNAARSVGIRAIPVTHNVLGEEPAMLLLHSFHLLVVLSKARSVARYQDASLEMQLEAILVEEQARNYTRFVDNRVADATMC